MTQTLTYLQHHQQLLKELTSHADELLAIDPIQDAQLKALHEELTTLASAPVDEAFYALGQRVLVKIVAGWPQLTPSVSRDLFWFFGGDCLQYMPDEEIANYQKLDEARFQAESTGEPFDIAAAKAKIFGLH
ncbi:hypothetical protein L1F30_10285 [Simiduia sp. 21SJ11W-1]|uniref:PA2817 family protein n=1 Tax=Simiduia sp. 21SJ11W-1 TaxID=2909669 RepID=UPI00209D8010|nr:PA2817 family protein [Simiduia sp. 21SJ11W-1]UTA46558.1 hypothetical protein L1F30_10285 [Simiduia sp. 21SJ11W-1]